MVGGGTREFLDYVDGLAFLKTKLLGFGVVRHW